MTKPDPSDRYTPEAVATRVEIAALDLNIAIRAATLMGITVSADIVDRPDPVFPDHTIPEVIVSAEV